MGGGDGERILPTATGVGQTESAAPPAPPNPPPQQSRFRERLATITVPSGTISPLAP